jgi:hypothetical protein
MIKKSENKKVGKSSKTSSIKFKTDDIEPVDFEPIDSIDDLLKDVDLSEFHNVVYERNVYRQINAPVITPEPTFDYTNKVVYICLSCGRYKLSVDRPVSCSCHKPIFAIDKTKEI